jgi:hypothetical protein
VALMCHHLYIIFMHNHPHLVSVLRVLSSFMSLNRSFMIIAAKLTFQAKRCEKDLKT